LYWIKPAQKRGNFYPPFFADRPFFKPLREQALTGGRSPPLYKALRICYFGPIKCIEVKDMRYEHLWADMHSNIHHNQMDQLERWYQHARQVMDFWPIAYYPFAIRRTPTGGELEDLIPQADYEHDWAMVTDLARRAEAEGWPLFPGYEWQGSGADGDHNVFFPGVNGPILHPMTYRELRDALSGTGAIAIPHHVAYQPGSRGKNWDTHDPAFSPFAEIYSSHGSSENDETCLPMDRHEHMGPRTDVTCYEAGLNKGIQVGCIASGDNHAVPGESDHGMMCVLSRSRTRADIWEGLNARRVYGVSRSRMTIDYTLDGVPMGGVVSRGPAEFALSLTAANAVDRVELLRDNILEKMLVHSGTWERTPLPRRFAFKFELEFGWGPETRLFPDAAEKVWEGRLNVPGRILSVEKLWNSFGQQILEQSEQSCDFRLTTHRGTETGKWMGPSQVRRESLIFEVEGGIDDVLTLTVDGEVYPLPVRQLLAGTRIYSQYRQSEEKITGKFGPTPHYRDDFIWHCAFKFRVRRAVPSAAYTVQESFPLSLDAGSQYRLRVWLKNGDAAWTSPVFCR